ncbi:MAG TPA: alcohol dehydrogenase catalytic domain-containing protein, partial [Ktedonobacteraceae bacterium]|nr:alcohol dehydrogenase catalytic domain-containing protein [Ktedonobacteraceae bacterium]
MWTSTLELSPTRVIPTNILGLFWRGAYFSSFAPLQIQNLPRHPLPSTSWVRVRNKLAGICGSDLHQVYGDGDFRISPAALPRHIRTYPGHEVVGEVIEVGEEVQQLGVGDRVILQHTPNCLTAGTQPLCRSCAVGNYNLCENGALPNPQQIGGGWSEEMLLHEQQLFLAPNAMSNEQAVMLEPTAVALRAVLHSLPQAGDRILIIGAGTIGLLILNIVRALAPETEISILAKHAFQVEQATRMGAAHIVYPQDSYTTIQRATGANLYRGMLGNQTLLGGYDIIYDTVGSPKTVHDALRWARAQANVVMVGLNLHLMRIDLSPIWNQ